MKTTLILNGSPRPEGNTAYLISQLKEQLQGRVIELSAFRDSISPCVDCRGCWNTAKCVVHDQMDLIYEDNFDNIVLASPIYFCTFPGQVLSVMSRLQPWHAATYFLHKPLELRPKKATAILTGGGKGNISMAQHHMRAFFRMLNAQGYQDHTVTSLQTDTIPSWEDREAIQAIQHLARWLND